MSKFKGTKGKWVATEFQTVYVKDLDWQICDTFCSNGSENTEELKANALLISKAPEMLDMLESVLKLRSLIEYDESIVNQQNIDEAIVVTNMLDQIEQLIKEATEL